MKAQLLMGFILTASFSATDVALAQTYTWVDENGIAHYGDSVPPKYSKKAEQVELQEAPKAGLTNEELRQLKRKTSKYKSELDRKRRAEARSKNQAARRASTTQSAQQTPTLTREMCRNAHPNITADRVRCFKEAEKNQQAPE